MKNLYTTLALVFINSILFAQLPSYVPANGLVAYYPFNGNANDLSGNNLNGTVNGATLTSDRYGNPNSAYTFNGINNYIEVNNNPLLNLNDSISISLWFNPTNPSAIPSQRLVDKETVNMNDGWLLDYGNKISSFNVATNTGPSLTTNQVYFSSTWYHLVATYNGSIVQFFINGILDTTISISGQTTSNTNPVRIGANSLLSGNWFSGEMDEIGIWNRALTTSEITALYNGSGSNCLIAYYPFTGNAGDSTVNGNNGTISGATLTTDRFGIPNSAYHFNGTTDYIQFASSPITNDQTFSISAWIYLDSSNAQFPILSLGCNGSSTLNEGTFGLYDNNLLTFETLGANDITSTNAVPTTQQWIQVAMVHTSTGYTTSVFKFYVNGIPYSANTQQGTNIPFPFNNVMSIGRAVGGGSGAFFKGKLDDVSIYNCALTDAQVDSLYSLTTSIEKDEVLKSFSIFPNPAFNKINLSYFLEDKSNVVIELYNIMGEKIKTIKNEIESPGNINVSESLSLNSGIYFIKVTAGSQLMIKKFVVID